MACLPHFPWYNHPDNWQGVKSQSSSLHNFFQLPVTTFLLGPNIFLSIMFSNTVCFPSSPTVREQAAYPHSSCADKDKNLEVWGQAIWVVKAVDHHECSTKTWKQKWSYIVTSCLQQVDAQSRASLNMDQAAEEYCTTLIRNQCFPQCIRTHFWLLTLLILLHTLLSTSTAPFNSWGSHLC
jgi:hypothetical protein